MKTGLNEAFIIDANKRNELIAKDPRSVEIIRPILRGKDIKRYQIDPQDKYIVMTHNGYIDDAGNKVRRVDIGTYPAIREHLDGFIDKLRPRTDQGDTPYNLRSCAYMDDFNRQKIMFQEMVQEPSFILDNKGFVCLDTARIITGDDLDLLIAVLNSKLFFYAIKTFYGGGSLGDKGIRMKHTFFNQFPCIHFSEEIAPIVKRLVSELSIGDHANIEKLKTIDNLVYKAYGLSEDERNFIESQ